MSASRRPLARCAVVAVAFCAAACSGASLSHTAYEQSYLAGRYNWSFRGEYSQAERLLNAFDYGHAILYQTLIARRDAAAQLDGAEFDFITQRLLPDPPNLAIDEAAVGPDYAKLIPEVVALFDWAHVLHRQLYDIWSMPGLTDFQRDSEAARALRYYRSRPDLALSTRPKSMALMESQEYSRSFRAADPKFNGLLWSYHWFQLALYDALLRGGSAAERRAAVDSTVRRFFAMIADAPSGMPGEMPMAPTTAPMFTARDPDAAIVFDNLHALHDVVADILLSPTVPPNRKRAAVLAAAAVYRDDTTSVISVDAWRQMARQMAPFPGR